VCRFVLVNEITTFFFNKLLFAYNTASYITYATNTYTTNITIHLRIRLKIQTQLNEITTKLCLLDASVSLDYQVL